MLITAEAHLHEQHIIHRRSLLHRKSDRGSLHHPDVVDLGDLRLTMPWDAESVPKW
jgi:hypothetical protein